MRTPDFCASALWGHTPKAFVGFFTRQEQFRFSHRLGKSPQNHNTRHHWFPPCGHQRHFGDPTVFLPGPTRCLDPATTLLRGSIFNPGGIFQLLLGDPNLLNRRGLRHRGLCEVITIPAGVTHHLCDQEGPFSHRFFRAYPGWGQNPGRLMTHFRAAEQLFRRRIGAGRHNAGMRYYNQAARASHHSGKASYWPQRRRCQAKRQHRGPTLGVRHTHNPAAWEQGCGGHRRGLTADHPIL